MDVIAKRDFPLEQSDTEAYAVARREKSRPSIINY